MQRPPRILIIILLCLITRSAASRNVNLVFSHHNANDGLSQNTVFSVTQDKSGNMWFATADGINKYNGYDYFLYGNKEGVDFAPITNLESHLYYDPNGQIYAFCGRTLLRYDKESDRFEKVSAGLTEGNIHALFRISGDCLLVASDKGVGCITDNGRTRQTVPSGIRSLDIHAFCPADKGFAMVTSSGDVYEFRNERLRLTASHVTECPVNEALYVGGNSIWLATDGDGIVCVSTSDGRSTRIRKAVSGLPSDYVRSICEDGHHRIWIGTADGLAIRDESGELTLFRHNTSNPSGLSHNSVKKIFRDTGGGIWLATYYGGVDYCYLDQIGVFNNVALGKGDDDIVGSVTEDSNGNIWVGTSRNGVYEYSPSSGSVRNILPFGQESGMNDIKSLYADPDGTLYLGTQYGSLVAYETEKSAFKRFDGAERPLNVYAILAHDKKWLYLGSSDGLWLFDKGDGSFTRISDLSYIYCLCRDADGILWAGAESGLFKCVMGNENGTPTVKKVEKAGSFTQVQCIYIKDRTYWVATRHGLYDGDGREWHLWNENNGLKCNNLHSIEEDLSGRLWVSSEHGLFCVIPSERRVAGYYREDGLNGNAFNVGASCRTRSGDLYFGGVNGLLSFSPERIVMKKDSNPPLISKILVNGQEIAFPKDCKLTLRHDQTSLSLEFFTSNYSSWRQDAFLYRLVNADNNWNSTNRSRVVNYSNLNPGSYVFELKSINNDGYPSKAVLSLQIVVKQVWYRTLAFKIGLFVIVLLYIGYAVYKTMKKNNLRNAERHKRDKKEIDRLTVLHFTGKPVGKEESDFLLKALKLVRDNIGDEQFGVASLADGMCMSRANLHLKFRKVADCSPQYFIHKVKFEAAAEMLTGTSLSIVEISEKLGFSSPSYFSTSFKRFTGKNPTEYR